MRAKRILLWSLGTLAAVLLIVCGAVLWTVNTQAGARWAVSLASKFTEQALQVSEVDGTIAGPLTLHDVRFVNAASGMDVRVGFVEVNVVLRELLGMTAHISNAKIRDVAVKLGESQKQAEPSQPFSLDPPLNILVDRFAAANVAITKADAPVVALDTAAVSANWTHDGINVKQLDVRSPDGLIDFVGSVANQRNYTGEGHGRFKWQVGTRTYAGTVAMNSRDGAVHADVDLTAPVNMNVAATLQQQDALPWTLDLKVPAFDPRKELMPSSSLQNLAADLSGSGTRTQGSLHGQVMVNDQTIELSQLAFEQRDKDLGLNADVRFGSGVVNAVGTVFTQQDPVTADMNLSWRDLDIPEQLAGQPLHTQGQLEFHGGAQAYRANGALKLGPPRKLADIELNLEGTPGRVQLLEFKINQSKGFARLAGTIDLKPTIGWNVEARTQHFDPGAFAVAWKGDLNLQLASEGQLKENGPTATLKLNELSGRLRNRPLQGTADLVLAENKVLSGNLNVASGRSRVRIDAKPGDAMDAVANIEIPSLDDWVPNGGGELHSRINARGRWPEMSISGTARGQSLHLASARADDFDLNFDIDRPKDPRGELALDAHGLAASGFEFASLSLGAKGDAQQHRVELNASGQPLSTELIVEGSKQTKDEMVGWTGSIQKAVFDIKNAAHLVLQEPAHVKYLGKALNLSESCFADGAIRLCASVDVAQDGAMQGDYLMRNVPLALANAFVPPSLAMTFEGTLNGNGNMRRDASGTVNGRAHIGSEQGRILRQFEATADRPQPLLTYANLNVDAQLSGANAQANVRAVLNETGSLQGGASLRGLGTASADVNGNLQAHLPSLSIIELFAPQLANVKGRADVDLSARGALDSPALNGQLSASELAMDVPVAGLKLRDGHIRVSPRGTNEFVLDGAMKSGDGRIALTGTALTTGIVNVELQGKKFLAADIPSAHVVIDPDLRLTRTAEKITVDGKVNVPSATVNLQKLPRNQGS
ncbi:MAG TPA: translocation/assembly module TamB domain-containing protein, partial [Steroidobacteraceae bacterium]|nr:translocation/assembly module TamB domain-containing protein [Steroidobacteraceae bacterium]